MMKTMMRSLACAAVLALTAGAQAALYTNTFTGPFANGGVIPDGNLSGWSDTRSLSFADNQIVDVKVTLNLTGGYNGDLYAYLVHDTGFAVLLNRVGVGSTNAFGYANAGMNLTLSSGGNDIHWYQYTGYGTNNSGQVTGDWRQDGRNISPLSSGAAFDSITNSATLASFNDLNPNGSWTLFFADVVSGDQSTLAGWGLEINAVPEPVTTALAIFGAIAGIVGVGRWMKQRKAAVS